MAREMANTKMPRRPEIRRKIWRGTQMPKIANGRYWSKNGVLSRDNGPAIEYDDGGKTWLVDGVCHREHGPVAEDPRWGPR